jgi:hypothetical protein
MELPPELINAIAAGVAAGLVIKGTELLIAGLRKLSSKTATKLDDAFVEALASAINAKIKK